MILQSSKLKQALLATSSAAVLAMLAVPALGSSPLATDDQFTLDALAVRIDRDNSYPVLKAEAKAAYVLAAGSVVSAEAASRLDSAIDELAFSAIQKAVNNDPFNPKVYWVNASSRSWKGIDVPGGRYSYDNPDCVYRTIPIDGASRYIIKGRRTASSPIDVTFSLISNPNSQQTLAILTKRDLVVAPDGTYTITIDNTPANGRPNHIQSNGRARQLFIRNNLGDWSSETPDAMSVQRLNDGKSYPVRSSVDIANEAWLDLQESIVDYGIGALGLKTHTNPINTLSSPSRSSTLGTLTTQASSFGYFRLADDEALVATVKTGGAGYLVFPVTDPWMVTVDPGRHQSSLNNVQAVPDPNGDYTFVVSVRDPGVRNWIDTVGLHEGTVMVRWQNLPEAQSPGGGPAIETRVVKLKDLAGVLPSGTRYVTSAERTRQLAERAAGYARRAEFQ
ncbi:hypothetical protein [Burkholderia sp. MSMB1078WGS]|uniref:hypothetical protein n=1 Tax=Burkholderia sp. MSMB1078WGS TaxID=1637900 RepID=UPI0009E74300|nr:hypothetical protein [Burkholderia sp. MSMB1078WGS]